MNYFGITYTVNSKGDCLEHAARPDGLPLCGSKASEDFQHTPSPTRGYGGSVNCGNCWRSLNARVRRARHGQLPSEGSHHWTIDGESACLHVQDVCMGSRELIEALAVRHLAAEPGAAVAVVKGPCPHSLAATLTTDNPTGTGS